MAKSMTGPPDQASAYQNRIHQKQPILNGNKSMTRKLIASTGKPAVATAPHATEFHVATTGDDANPGTKASPLHTIQRAANLRQTGRCDHRA